MGEQGPNNSIPLHREAYKPHLEISNNAEVALNEKGISLVKDKFWATTFVFEKDRRYSVVSYNSSGIIYRKDSLDPIEGKNIALDARIIHIDFQSGEFKLQLDSGEMQFIAFETKEVSLDIQKLEWSFIMLRDYVANTLSQEFKILQGNTTISNEEKDQIVYSQWRGNLRQEYLQIKELVKSVLEWKSPIPSKSLIFDITQFQKKLEKFVESFNGKKV